MARGFVSIAAAVIGAVAVWMGIFLSLSPSPLGRVAASPAVTELHVCKAGCAYTTVQAAIDAAATGDEIRIASGIYTDAVNRAGQWQIAHITRSVALRGGFTTTNWFTPDLSLNPVTLDAGASGRVIYVGAGLTVTLEGLRARGGAVTGNGGGIYTASPLTLTQVSVLSNTASGYGGGLYAQNGIMLSGTALSANTAVTGGGGAYVLGDLFAAGSQFINNTAQKSSGGGLYAMGAIRLSDAQFLSNTAVTAPAISGAGGGGAYGLADVTAQATLFQNNAGNSYGGGLYAGGTLIITGGQFISNTAAQGGGAYAAGMVSLAGGLFDRNDAQSEGGGLWAQGQTALSGTTFTSNTTRLGDGGGALVKAGALTAGGAVFVANFADGNGGGASVPSGHAFLTAGLFERNATRRLGGAGAYVGVNLTVTGTRFLSNTAQSSTAFGGGASANRATLQSAQFEANRSGSAGGLYVSTDLTDTGSLFLRNSATSTLGNGGGAYALGGAALNGTRFERNQAGQSGGGLYALKAVTLTGPAIVDNASLGGAASAGGGGVYAGGGGLINAGLIGGNTSAGDGGGLVANGSLLMTGVEISNNLAASDGGGLYASQAATLVNTTFFSNASQTTGTLNGGGGAFLNADSLILGGLFDRNRAIADGGGVYALAGVSISGTRFVSNTAAGNGGGLNERGFTAGSAITITQAQFIGNRAMDGGGIWTRNTSSNRLVNVLLARNSVTNTGAAIYVYRGTVDIAHVTIAGPALNPGAAIFVTGTSTSRVNITNTLIAKHATGIARAATSVVTEDYTLFYSNTLNLSGTVTSGGHSLSGDPKFLSINTDNLHLGAGSAAIDHGANLGIAVDLDGLARPVGSAPDIGAYEWRPLPYAAYLPLVMR